MKKKETTASIEQKYFVGIATEDITVRVSNNDKDCKFTSIAIETQAGAVFVKGFTRKSKAGVWFFSAPSHKYNDDYVDDVIFDKAVRDSINNTINGLLS